MSKIIRTSDLTILKCWLIGGQVTPLNNCTEGFHSFTESDCNEHLFVDGKLSKALIKKEIEHYLDEHGDRPSNGINQTFEYYGQYYRFKYPSDKNMKILVNRIYHFIEKIVSDENLNSTISITVN